MLAVSLYLCDSGNKGVLGASGIQGQTGHTGQTGAPGPKGDVGESGPAGSKGSIGKTILWMSSCLHLDAYKFAASCSFVYPIKMFG